MQSTYHSIPPLQLSSTPFLSLRVTAGGRLSKKGKNTSSKRSHRLFRLSFIKLTSYVSAAPVFISLKFSQTRCISLFLSEEKRKKTESEKERGGKTSKFSPEKKDPKCCSKSRLLTATGNGKGEALESTVSAQAPRCFDQLLFPLLCQKIKEPVGKGKHNKLRSLFTNKAPVCEPQPVRKRCVFLPSVKPLTG